MKNKNTSISKRLIKSFAVLLMCMVIVNLISVTINLKTVNQYKSIINNIVLEGQVQGKASELVGIYNSIITDSGKVDKKTYDKKWSEIQSILLKLDKTKYKVINNIMLQVRNKMTQIDHVVVSNYGIFVIETKNYKGWIIGNEFDDNWKQVIY